MAAESRERERERGGFRLLIRAAVLPDGSANVPIVSLSERWDCSVATDLLSSPAACCVYFCVLSILAAHEEGQNHSRKRQSSRCLNEIKGPAQVHGCSPFAAIFIRGPSGASTLDRVWGSGGAAFPVACQGSNAATTESFFSWLSGCRGWHTPRPSLAPSNLTQRR